MAAERVRTRAPSNPPAARPREALDETVRPDEAFLDDIRVSLQEIDEGHVLDSRQRLAELQAQLKQARHDC